MKIMRHKWSEYGYEDLLKSVPNASVYEIFD